MILKMHYQHVVRVVGMACDLADHELPDEQAAILWTVRNCLAQSPAKITIETVTDICCGLQERSGCGQAFPENWKSDDFSETFYCRVFGMFCSILACDVPDISDNAISFHRHDIVPHWSKQSEPSALIGRYFFYNDLSLYRPSKVALPQPELGLAYA